MFGFVWFDLHYCKESSGFLIIVFFCGLTFISLHNLPLRLNFNVCVIFFVFVVLPFALDSLFLFSLINFLALDLCV